MAGGWAPGGAATSERGAVPGEGLARAGRWRGAKGAFQELWSEQETPRWVGGEAVLSPKGALLWGGWGDRGPPRLCPFEPLEEEEAAGKRPGPQPGALGPPPHLSLAPRLVLVVCPLSREAADCPAPQTSAGAGPGASPSLVPRALGTGSLFPRPWHSGKNPLGPPSRSLGPSGDVPGATVRSGS